MIWQYIDKHNGNFFQTDQGADRFFRFQTASGQYRKEVRLWSLDMTWVDVDDEDFMIMMMVLWSGQKILMMIWWWWQSIMSAGDVRYTYTLQNNFWNLLRNNISLLWWDQSLAFLFNVHFVYAYWDLVWSNTKVGLTGEARGRVTGGNIWLGRSKWCPQVKTNTKTQGKDRNKTKRQRHTFFLNGGWCRGGITPKW